MMSDDNIHQVNNELIVFSAFPLCVIILISRWFNQRTGWAQNPVLIYKLKVMGFEPVKII